MNINIYIYNDQYVIYKYVIYTKYLYDHIFAYTYINIYKQIPVLINVLKRKKNPISKGIALKSKKESNI